MFLDSLTKARYSLIFVILRNIESVHIVLKSYFKLTLQNCCSAKFAYFRINK